MSLNKIQEKYKYTCDACADLAVLKADLSIVIEILRSVTVIKPNAFNQLFSLLVTEDKLLEGLKRKIEETLKEIEAEKNT